MVRIVIDAMGGDHAPGAILEGTIDAVNAFEDLHIIAVGREPDIKECLKGKNYDAGRLEIVHANDVISNEEKPVLAVRRSKDSSIVKGLELVAKGEADGFVSAGSTGAVLAGATLIVKRLDGVLRPALAPVLPTAKGGMLLIDCGANVDCKPDYLAQFAVMGSIYMEKVIKVKNPRVAIINNGAEEGKGNDLVKAAAPLIASMPVRYVGNVEGRELTAGDVDVAVCDGFVGNVVLKLMEGFAKTLFSMIKQELTSSTRAKMGAALLMPSLKSFKKKMDYTEYGGAPLLGVNGAVVKAHGSSNQKAYYHAVRQAYEMVKYGVHEMIKQEIGHAVSKLQEDMEEK